jgi:predicted TIM-barrel fold metal-dependent hydrolase
MGRVDLDFKPAVPVFDANVALGRRHDKRVVVDTVEGTLEVMDRSGVDRALVYAPHAATFDSRDGNAMLMEQIGGESRLVPQFVCSPAFHRLNAFAEEVREAGVRSVRMLPGLHNYPFRDWVIGPWLEWLADTRIPLWLPTDWQTGLKGVGPFSIDPRDVYDTLKANPGVTAVLCEVRYDDASWALPLLRSLPNLHIEISRFVVTGGIEYLLEAAGEERILFGSRFPDSAMALHLYSLHHSGLGEQTLRAICAGNLDRLLDGRVVAPTG